MAVTNKGINGQLIPHNIEAEEAVLGGLIIEPDMLIETDYLKDTDFYMERYGWIFRVISDLSDKGKPVDNLTIADELEQRGQLEKIGGPALLADFVNATPTSIHVGHYGKLVYRDAIRRRLIHGANKIAQLAYNPDGEDDPENLIGQAITILDKIGSHITGGPVHIEKATGTFLDGLENKQNGETGLKTGIADLDKILGHVEENLYLLAGRPGMGKSGLAFTIARNLALQGKRVDIYSLEMSKEAVIRRLVAQQTGIDTGSIKNASLTEDEWLSVVQATDEISRWPILIDDSPGLTIANIKSRSQRVSASRYGPPDLIIVDHFGIAKSGRKNLSKYEESSSIADQAMALPKELGCPVLGLLQLSRKVEATSNKRPNLSHLRDSGKWEENADTVMFLYREAHYTKDDTSTIAEIIVEKNREGRTGTVYTYWQANTTQVMNLKK